MDGTGLILCPVVGFTVSDVEPVLLLLPTPPPPPPPPLLLLPLLLLLLLLLPPPPPLTPPPLLLLLLLLILLLLVLMQNSLVEISCILKYGALSFGYWRSTFRDSTLVLFLRVKNSST